MCINNLSLVLLDVVIDWRVTGQWNIQTLYVKNKLVVLNINIYTRTIKPNTVYMYIVFIICGKFVLYSIITLGSVRNVGHSLLFLWHVKIIFRYVFHRLHIKKIYNDYERKNVLIICTLKKNLCLIHLSLGPSWSWSYGRLIYNYLCNQCLSPLMLWVGTPLIARWFFDWIWICFDRGIFVVVFSPIYMSFLKLTVVYTCKIPS